ncbi:hypothetical protein FH969_13505 [Miniimonas arenae]|uniref:DUF4352 domain-containing protein n=1 Tax=Miniimonas arenae TaxID=676201 RepID=A0A5C5BAR5_9MICO|nr:MULTISPECIES: hypothetical protein [Miniimonas]TNU73045.1 hypothetical protein FH969_13505 [Miniimonas arenae]
MTRHPADHLENPVRNGAYRPRGARNGAHRQRRTRGGADRARGELAVGFAVGALGATGALLAGCTTDDPATSGDPVPAATSAGAAATGAPTTLPFAEPSRSAKPRHTEDPSATASATVEVFEDATLSPRGYLEKDIGQIAGIGPTGVDEVTARLWLREVRWDPTCQAGTASPENGRYLGLRFDVELEDTWPQDVDGDLTFTPDQFETFTADGGRSSVSSADTGCLPASEGISPVGVGESASGWVVLDVSDDAGIVAYTPYLLYGGGWEWSIPAAP